MTLGEKLINLRKKEGLSQEEVAEKLNVSRQTISKWENNQTTDSLNKIKEISKLFNVSYDYLINEKSVETNITNIEAIVEEIDWTKAWSKKYPILKKYPEKKGIKNYDKEIENLYNKFKSEYQTDDTDTVLILKDLLYLQYKKAKKQI